MSGIDIRSLVLIGLAFTATLSGIHAEGPDGPGFILVEETIWCDVIKKVCRTVPDVKKTSKWVYVVEHEDFCTKRCKLRGGCGDCSGEPACAACAHPRCRGNLVKKLVQESHPTTKCVVEEVIERVPFKVYRKVPCSGGPIPASAPGPASGPAVR